MAFTFPGSDLDRPATVMSLLGGFWRRTYGGRDQVAAYLGAVAAAARQAHADLVEVLACVSRFTVPVAHVEAWVQVPLAQSAATTSVVNQLAYGDDRVAAMYGPAYDYGAPLAGRVPAYPIAPGLDAALLFDAPAGAVRSYVRGLDFAIAAGRISFAADPFADPRLTPTVRFDARGRPVDRELTLWAFRGRVDRQDIYRHFGHVLGLELPSSSAYRDTVNALFDAIVGGTAAQQLKALLAALTGSPLALGAEAVRAIGAEADRVWVATDAHAYSYPPGATPVVAVGDMVAAGDPLVATVVLHELNAGAVPAGLTSLALGPGLLGPGYAGDLSFGNDPVPLVVAQAGGRTMVSFALGGFPADVARFWAAVHARGLAAGKTLAQYLDARPDPAGDPTAASLPATIVPLAFLCTHLLRGGVAVATVDVAGVADPTLLTAARLLDSIMPPHALLLTRLAMPRVVDPGTVGRDGAATALPAAAPYTDRPGWLPGTDRAPVGVVLSDVIQS